ncbi:MAG: GNAT family N-acetyltransferase [Cytophagales bacterium]|nr:GNAT family N-acetyltransferase [Cytophagales bacterium]
MLTLETNRLLLHPFKMDDIEVFHQINTDPFIRQYLWDDVVIDQSTAQEILATNRKQFDHHQLGLWKIRLKSKSEIIGYTGLWNFFDEPQPQLIYALLPQYSKLGFASEAAQAIIDYAFRELGFTYLIAATDEPHKASQHVAQRLGMSFVEKRIEDGKATLFYRLENSQGN